MELKDCGYAFYRGVYDSCNGIKTAFYLDSELNAREALQQAPSNITTPLRRRHKKDDKLANAPKKELQFVVLKRIFYCSLVNLSVFLAFEYGILPVQRWLDSVITFWWLNQFIAVVTYTLLGGVIFICKILNCLMFQDIADAAFKYSRGRRLCPQSIGQIISDAFFSTLVESVFLLQAIIISYVVPIAIVGNILYWLHMCLLYSLYVFEYKWCNMSWQLHKRLSFIEYNWVYFLGFGLPLMLITSFFNSWLTNVSIFSITFPFFLVSGHVAMPITGVTQYPLRLFSPVIFLFNETYQWLKSTRNVPTPKVAKKSS